jgi:fibronectin-binding autotransporter adhesin
MKSKKTFHQDLTARSSSWLGVCSITFCVFTTGQSMAQGTWDGGGADNNWTTGLNWAADTAPASGALTFADDINTITNNDNVVNTTFTAINFTNNGLATSVTGPPAGVGTAAFTLNGNTITLGGNISGSPIATGGVAITDIINLNLILNGNRTVTTNVNHSVTINGIINETGAPRDLTKGGSLSSGTLTLTGNNTYTGITVIQNGILSVTKIADSGDSNMGLGNSIRMASANTVATLNYTGTGDTTARSLQIGDAAQLSGTGGATINHNGANGGTGLVFSAANFTLAQTSTAVSRTLTLGGSNTDANQISGTIANVSGTTATNLAKANAGLWIVSGANTYTGTTAAGGGTLAGIGANAFGNTTGITIAGAGTLSLRGDSSTSFVKTSDSSLYTVSASATQASVNVDRATPAGTSAKTMTIGPLMTSSIAAAYQLNFTGANNTSLSAGSMTGPASAAVATVNISNNIAGGGNLTLASYTSANATAGETVTFSGNGTTIVTGTVNPSATPLSLTKSGAGILRLDSSSAYTGLTNVIGGVLHLNHTTALPAASTLTLSGGVLGLGAVDFTRSIGTLVGQVSIGNNSGFAAYGADRSVNIGGAGALVNWNATAPTITGTTLVLGSPTATHTVTFLNPIDSNGGRFLRADDGAAAVDGIFAGNITGTGFRSKIGAGTLQLNGTGNTWTGGTFIDSGTLRLGAAGVLPNGQLLTVKRANGAGNTDGVLDLAGNDETIGGLTLGSPTGEGTLQTAGQTPSVVNSGAAAILTLGGNLTYDAGNSSFLNGQATITANVATGTAGTRLITVGDGISTEDLVISGDLTGAAIAKDGAGTLALSSAEHTGDTTVSLGTLTLSAANPNNDTSTVTIAASGATLNLTYAGTDYVSGLVIGANPPLANGIYAGFSGPGITVIPQLTGAGTITVGPVPSDPYTAWSGGAIFDDDANNDGVDNGLAWLLGAGSPTGTVTRPTVTQTGGSLQITFSMLKFADRGAAMVELEHSSNLGISDPWTSVLVPEVSGGPTSGVTFNVNSSGALNSVTAIISSSEAAAGKLFGRLKGIK